MVGSVIWELLVTLIKMCKDLEIKLSAVSIALAVHSPMPFLRVLSVCYNLVKISDVSQFWHENLTWDWDILLLKLELLHGNNNICCMKYIINPQRHTCRNKRTLTPNKTSSHLAPWQPFSHTSDSPLTCNHCIHFRRDSSSCLIPLRCRLVSMETALGCVPAVAPGELTYYSGWGPATNDGDLCGTRYNLCHSFDQPDLSFGLWRD